MIFQNIAADFPWLNEMARHGGPFSCHWLTGHRFLEIRAQLMCGAMATKSGAKASKPFP